MISRIRFYNFWLRIAAYSIPCWAFLLAFYFRFHSMLFTGPAAYSLADYTYLLAFTSVMWAVCADHYRLTRIENLLWDTNAIRASVRTCLATAALQLVVLFFVRSVSFSRMFVVLNIVLLLVLTLALRFGFLASVGLEYRQSKPLRILIVGTDEYAQGVAQQLRATRVTNCFVAGFVHVPGHRVSVQGAPVYELDSVDHLDVGAFDDVVVAIPLTTFQQVAGALSLITRLCKPIRAVLDFGNGMVLGDNIFQYGNLQIVNLATTAAESMSYLIAKRLFDIAFSLSVLIVLSPVLSIIALAVKLTSPGPVFFMQERVGLNGKLFKMYKFRSMRVTTTAESDERWTCENDPRRTAFGTFLRKASLDELPQFINVLRGDMSVVGPRPERPHFVRKFLGDINYYNERHRLKVGITGWAQVNGWRGDTSITRRVECDLYYLQNWSILFDLKIIARTIWSGLVNKNAY